MANCTASDVRLIIDTGLEDVELGELITLADEEITVRGLSGAPWTANNLRSLSMRLAAELAALNDTSSRSTGAFEERSNQARKYRQQAEELIMRVGEVPFAAYGEPVVTS
jgi:hypothetical protein